MFGYRILPAGALWCGCRSLPTSLEPGFRNGCNGLLVHVPLVIFGLRPAASSIAMIYAPLVLARPWPLVLAAAPVRLIQVTAGVAPLLFLNVLPLYQPTMQIIFMELWLAFGIAYFAAAFVMLIANYRRLDDLREKEDGWVRCAHLSSFSES
jgi:hypothetical protein